MTRVPIVFHEVLEDDQRDLAAIAVMHLIRLAAYHHELHHVDVYPGMISLHCSCGDCFQALTEWPFPGPHRVSIGGVMFQRAYEPLVQGSVRSGGRRYPCSAAELLAMAESRLTT